MEETLEDGLKRILSKKEFVLAIKHTHWKKRKKVYHFKNDCDIITAAFIWDKQIEGLDFWHDIWLKVRNKECRKWNL